MKKTILAAFAALGTFGFMLAGAQAAELTAVSKITQVTVYQDRALVVRECAVDLTEGPNTVAFENLPSALIEDSLRAEGQGASRVTINGVELKKKFGTEEADPNAARISAELEKLQNDMQELLLKQQAVSRQKGFIDSISNFSSMQISKDIMTKSPTPVEWAGISQYLLEAYGANNVQTLALTQTIKDKNKEVEAKQKELNDSWSGHNIEKKTVRVNLEAKAKAAFTLRLYYQIPQASWTISYDAKVTQDTKTCALISYGNVRQWTGEDWKDVNLTLSSVKPAVGGRMPELDPWYVDFMQMVLMDKAIPLDYANVQLRKKGQAAGARMAMKVSKEEETTGYDARILLDRPAELSEANVSQELGAATFELAKPVTVPGDGQFYKFPVKTESLAVKFDYETTPKISLSVFLHSKVINDKDYPLMAGLMDLFVNDNFVGKSSIKTIGIGESFDLYLGVEEGIKVKRTELVDKKKKTLLGMRVRKDYAYKFELENYKKENVNLTVIDQLPISKNADIKVGLVTSDPKPTETKDLGITKWAFELAPKQKRVLEFDFFVEYPSDKVVMGV